MSAFELIECSTCGCGRPHDDHKRQIAVGKKIEREHTKSPKRAEKIAKDHIRENPDYYPTGKKPDGSKEALRYVKEGIPLFKIKLSGKAIPVQLQERHWVMSLGLDLEAFGDDFDPAEAKQQIVTILRAKLPEVNQKLDAHAASEFENIIDEFNMCDDETEAIDYVLQMLYDWGDANSVWTGKDDKGGGGSFQQSGEVEL